MKSKERENQNRESELSGLHSLKDIGKHQVPPTRLERNFLNRDEYQSEIAKFILDFERSKPDAKKVVLKGPPKDLKRWNNLLDTFDDIQEIYSIYSDDLGKVDKEGSDSWLKVAVLSVSYIGAQLSGRKNLQEQKSLARKFNVSDIYEKYLKILEYNLASTVTLKIGDIALWNFLNKEREKPIPYYKFLLEGSSADDRNLYDKILSDNKGTIASEYPNITKEIIFTIPNKINSFLSLHPDLIRTTAKRSRYPLSEVIELSARVMESIQKTRDEIFKILKNPKSEHFNDLKAILNEYISDPDKKFAFHALNLAGLYLISNVKELYRVSNHFISLGVEKEFYSKLADLSIQYAKEASKLENFPLEEDIDLIIDLEKKEETTVTDQNFDEIGKIVSEIFQKTSENFYSLAPEEVQWKGLSLPKNLEINFDKNNSRKFEISLVFLSEEGEDSFDIKFKFDTNKRLMDWNYLPDPNSQLNERLSSLKSFLLSSTASILFAIKDRVEAEYKRKKEAEKGKYEYKSIRKKGERFEDEAYRQRKEMKAERKISENDRQEEIPIFDEEEHIRNEITIPSPIDLEKKIRSLSFEDRNIVLKRLEEFNRTQKGELRRKRRLGPDGRQRWGLRVSCQTPKGARVLLAPQEFSKGIRKFEIIDIRYRKDIYPKNKI